MHMNYFLSNCLSLESVDGDMFVDFIKSTSLQEDRAFMKGFKRKIIKKLVTFGLIQTDKTSCLLY